MSFSFPYVEISTLEIETSHEIAIIIKHDRIAGTRKVMNLSHDIENAGQSYKFCVLEVSI